MLLRVWPEGAVTALLGNGARLPSGAVTPGTPVWIPAAGARGGLRVCPDPPGRLGEGEPERDGPGEDVLLGDGEGVGVPVGDGEGVGVPVGDGDGDGGGVPVGEGEGAGVPVGEGDRDGAGVPVGEGDGAGVPVGEGDGVPAGVGETDGEPAADSSRATAEVACGRVCPEPAAA